MPLQDLIRADSERSSQKSNKPNPILLTILKPHSLHICYSWIPSGREPCNWHDLTVHTWDFCSGYIEHILNAGCLSEGIKNQQQPCFHSVNGWKHCRDNAATISCIMFVFYGDRRTLKQPFSVKGLFENKTKMLQNLSPSAAMIKEKYQMGRSS